MLSQGLQAPLGAPAQGSLPASGEPQDGRGKARQREPAILREGVAVYSALRTTWAAQLGSRLSPASTGGGVLHGARALLQGSRGLTWREGRSTSVPAGLEAGSGKHPELRLLLQGLSSRLGGGPGYQPLVTLWALKLSPGPDSDHSCVCRGSEGSAGPVCSSELPSHRPETSVNAQSFDCLAS